jgi:hypothetical protein
MCGEISWNGKDWTPEKDETKRFLQLTGLQFSEDFEHSCSDKQGCHGDNSDGLHAELDRERQPGDPKIPESLKHRFRKCDHHHKVDHWGKAEKDYKP